MKVVNIFKSIQGEGPDMGKQAVFVRCGRCNLDCSFCDTKYALGTAGEEMSESQIRDAIYELDSTPHLIIFTGGEPMLQYDEISTFGFPSYTEFAIETNGKLPPGGGTFGMGMHCVVSPKLGSAVKNGYTMSSLLLWSEQSWVTFKFVVTCPDDLVEIGDILNYLPTEIPIILQPNGQTDDYALALRELYGWVENWNLRYRVQILPQLHRIMWGKNARGI